MSPTIIIAALIVLASLAIGFAFLFWRFYRSSDDELRRLNIQYKEKLEQLAFRQEEVDGWSASFKARRADGELTALFYDRAQRRLVESRNGSPVTVTGYTVRYDQEPVMSVDTSPVEPVEFKAVA